MIEETIRQIEERLQNARNLSPETRAELLSLLTKLRDEASRLPRGKSLPDLAGAAAEGKSVQEDVERLRSAVEEFEDSHPKLVQLVNHLANTLAGLGI